MTLTSPADVFYNTDTSNNTLRSTSFFQITETPAFLFQTTNQDNIFGGKNTMSCASIYTANTASQSVAVNAAVNLGTIQRRYGCSLNAGASSVSIGKPGYYLVNATFTFTAPATGVAAISLQQNGTQVAGATVADTVTTATTEQNTMSMTAIVRSFTCNDTLAFVNTGIAITPSNVAVTVVKL